MPAESEKTEDGFSAVVTHGNTGKTENLGGTLPATAAQPSDTATGLIVLGILGYILFRFLRRH